MSSQRANLPPIGFSVSTGVSSITSPSYTSFVSLILKPTTHQRIFYNRILHLFKCHNIHIKQHTCVMWNREDATFISTIILPNIHKFWKFFYRLWPSSYWEKASANSGITIQKLSINPVTKEPGLSQKCLESTNTNKTATCTIASVHFITFILN